MAVIGLIVVWGAIFGVSFWFYRRSVVHARAQSRLGQPDSRTATANSDTAANSLAADADDDSDRASMSRPRGRGAASRRLTRRYWWVPVVLGGVVMLAIATLLRWPIQYVLAIGAVVSLVASQLESFLFTRYLAKLDHQLADAIDIMVGGLGAGAAVGPAIESAIAEIDLPLRPYLEEISGRIRLGDDPVEVFRSLADRVPLETFLLFSSALAVHWEVGGRLAPTLASVGRTVRDRIEVTRRVQSNIAQSQFSTLAILGLTYLIALIVWRSGPEQMEEFVSTTVGSWFVAGSIMLQAVGIVWMSLISKPKY